MDKNFDDWHFLKKSLNKIQNPPSFEEREIWWCSIGTNIGHEENGKNELFSRPVLVVRKFNKHIFLGVPLTTKIKEHHKFYHKIHFKENTQSIMLSQVRVWESRRLTNPMGKLSVDQFNNLRNLLGEVIKGNYPNEK